MMNTYEYKNKDGTTRVGVKGDKYEDKTKKRGILKKILGGAKSFGEGVLKGATFGGAATAAAKLAKRVGEKVTKSPEPKVKISGNSKSLSTDHSEQPGIDTSEYETMGLLKNRRGKPTTGFAQTR